MRRTSTGISLLPPTAMMLRRCRAVSSWPVRHNSGYLSHQEECAPLGLFKFSRFVGLGVVKAPFTWLEQFAQTAFGDGSGQRLLAGLPDRTERRCISLASTSFPVPFSPVMRMLASVAATFSPSAASLAWLEKSPIAWLLRQTVISTRPLRSFSAFAIGLGERLHQLFVVRFHHKVDCPLAEPRHGQLYVSVGREELHCVWGCSRLISRNQYSPRCWLLSCGSCARPTTSGLSSRSRAGMLSGGPIMVIHDDANTIQTS